MAKVRTVDFLPEIFQTETNKQFLSATLDQLVQEPRFELSEGFIGLRTGSGVNANDQYVIEPTVSRENYQLDPAVVITDPNNNQAIDALTYPGMIDSLTLRGSPTVQPDRLFASEFYAWDPMMDFDKFVNFSEYYWLPNGPADVSVFGSALPVTASVNVVRNASRNSYTFDLVPGENPTITLVRGGTYRFNLDQLTRQTVTFNVTNRGSTAYVINFEPNPTLTLERGNTYEFALNFGGTFPFWIKTQATNGLSNIYNDGVINNGASSGVIRFTVPSNAPDELFYACQTSLTMQGRLSIIDPVKDSGPRFWIQAQPGVDGTMPNTPNISSRDVYGVVNNGENFGTVEFNVPIKTAQNFYYTLNDIGAVDLATNTLKFSDVNNAYVSDFIQQYGGIDGVSDLNDRTVVFLQDVPVRDINDAEFYGWYTTIGYSPNVINDVIEPGDYDNPSYGTLSPIIPKSQRYAVYLITYLQDGFGETYMKLTLATPVEVFQKFTIISGVQYSNTQWYKNADEVFEQIPLLTAALDQIYYQDSFDPSMYGIIRLIEQDNSARIFVDDIIGAKNYTSPNGVVFSNGLKVTFQGDVFPTSYLNKTYYVEGVGSSIKLLPVTDFLTPESYAGSVNIAFDVLPFDTTNFDVEDDSPLTPDYLTINRASPDLNPWSRYNRWFHRQVIEASATYNNVPPDLNQEYRARRPIIERDAGLKLFDFGFKGKIPVNVIDFQTTDAFSQIYGQTQYNIDGVTLFDGYRVIFAADTSVDVRNRVYEIKFITPDTLPPFIAQPIITLVPTSDNMPVLGDTVVCLNGNTEKGVSFYFDGETWQQSQQKTKINQAPLFDVYDEDGISFSNSDRYPSSTFDGTAIFTYAVGTGAVDPVLGFPLKYLTINNVGDIVFDNNFYTDTFLFVVNRGSSTKLISSGFIRQYNELRQFKNLIGWQPAANTSAQYQQFKFKYDGTPLQLDIPVLAPLHNETDNTEIPLLKVYVADKFVSPEDYTYVVNDRGTTIFLEKIYTPDDIVEVLALSPIPSQVAFYEIPINLENNPFNVNSDQFTLGTVRSHYESIAENIVNFVGPINGSNNSRDLGNLVVHGLQILEQSSPLPMAGFFMRNRSYDIFASIQYNSQEYVKFKNKLMDAVARNDFNNETVAEIFTKCMAQVNVGQTQQSPFYWSDMLPAGSILTSRSYTFTAISTPFFDTSRVYDFTSSNYQALNVYINNRLLVRDYEFITLPNAASLEITAPLTPGDVILIQEFESTIGNFVPNTPTKMGLYPAYKPQIYVDNTYVRPTTIILGHDGSKTVAFGDIRDEILLEFEIRIFNNLKIVSPIPITADEIIPDAFTVTGYTKDEVQEILNQDFLSWVGWNRLDYVTQTDFNPNDAFSWNYSQSGNRLTGTPLPGAWRGIYLEYYGTISPHLTPWEMLGFTQEPSWWVDRYGSAPYTEGNKVLWDDLEAGRIADPNNDRIDIRYARPGLTKIIPSGPQGQLLAPIDAVVGAFSSLTFKNDWKAGDMAPVEYSWRVSSSYPFAIMRLMVLTKPAEFFALFADRDRYVYDTEMQQYLYDKRYRIDARSIQVYGTGKSKASYINWIVDYSAYLGNLQAADLLQFSLVNLDVRLTYRMAGFSNKQYIKIFLEKPSPDSVNTSLLLPDDSFDLLLYKNQAFAEITWSSVIVQRTASGWQVFGYSVATPYFQILQSDVNSPSQTIFAGNTKVTVPTEYTDQVVKVPYGFNFNTQTLVVDFLLSYGAYLNNLGMTFQTVENGYVMNWNQMAQEFLYWSNQGWEIGSIINLNPTALELSVSRPLSVVNSLQELNVLSQPQDQNRQLLTLNDLVIDRSNNTFRMFTQNEQTISFVNLEFINYEHILVMQNKSVFGDLMYQPSTGQRQNRLKFVGYKTLDWNGEVDAQGFILNQNNVKEWEPNVKYTKGQIVQYKNLLYSALTIVQPKLKFDANDWTISEYSVIQKGLLPNIPNKANQLATSYDINQANLEVDTNLLSFGLTGFRPRQYMTNLDLNDISQVNVYRQFTRSKGTIGAVRLLTNANLGKESAEYEVYENWAILTGIYGAQDNRRYVDLRLDAAFLTSNLDFVEVIDPNQESQADQTILLANVFGSSYLMTSKNFLPTSYTTLTSKSLPSAGYVNIEDTDIQVFSIADPFALTPYLDQLGAGTVIWVAADNEFDWNVYSCATVGVTAVLVTDNLNGTCLVTCTGQHFLTAQQIVIIKEFSAEVNGVYRIIEVPSLDTFVISLDLEGDITSITGIGLIYRLQTMRVVQAANAVDLPYTSTLLPGVKVWVDNNGLGLWEVIEKTFPLIEYSVIQAPVSGSNSYFGKSVAQRADNLAALVGMPGVTPQGMLPGAGAIASYVLDSTSQTYRANGQETLINVAGLQGYGTNIAIGANNWAVAGAPQSKPYPINNDTIGFVGVLEWSDLRDIFLASQILLPLDQPGPIEFGTSVAISNDERWVYVGAPKDNAVYAYGRKDIENQVLTFVSNGSQLSFNASAIQFSLSTELQVFVNDVEIYFGQQWSLSGSNVVLGIPAPVGQIVRIQRRVVVVLNEQWYINLAPSSSVGSGSNARFNIQVLSGKYFVTVVAPGANYNLGDTLTFDGTIFGGVTGINDCVVTVDDIGPFGDIENFIVSGNNVPISGLPTVYNIDQYLWGLDGNIESFTVVLNGQMQRPKYDYEFVQGAVPTPDSTAPTWVLELLFTPTLGDYIEVFGSTHFVFVEKIQPAGLPINAKFGHSVACGSDGRQVVIGTPGRIVDGKFNAGSVYVYSRHVERFQVTDASQQFYTTNVNLVGPTTVYLNSQLQTNTLYYKPGTYTPGVNNVYFVNPLSVGDNIEIETNQFLFVQELSLSGDNNQVQAQYGYAVDLCGFNCSLYAGAPNWSNVNLLLEGMVGRSVNQARLYGVITSTNANPILNPGDTLRINNYEIAIPVAATLQSLADLINTGIVPNVMAEVSQGLITFMIVNPTAAIPGNKLEVLPGAIGTAFTDIGFNVFVYTQTIRNPKPDDETGFGTVLDVSSDANTLLVGAPTGNAIIPVTFDNNTTTFDDKSTLFMTTIANSGVVYEYDYLSAANETVNNPGKFIFGQQIYGFSTASGNQFGTSINYTNRNLMVGLPGFDNSNISATNLGLVDVYINANNTPSWLPIHVEREAVVVDLINSVSLYDRLISTTNEFLDFFDPLQGKILGVCERNIDFVGPVDPASYNVGDFNNLGNTWLEQQVGTIWWNTSKVRFINPNTGDIEYAAKRWGQIFPGSEVEIYQWIASTELPGDYSGTGTPLDIERYAVLPNYTASGIIQPVYFYWVKNIINVNTRAGKTLSAATIAQYLSDPAASGISYVIPLSASAIGLVNTRNYISAADTILHIEFDVTKNDANVHTEYDLIADGRENSKLSENLFLKLVDSLCGIDVNGRAVPDTSVAPSMRYGVLNRPRQSMFINRYLALKNFVDFSNRVMAQFPISELNLSFSLLNSKQPEPSATSGEWNFRVEDLEQLGWQNINIVPVGYRYLVAVDENNQGRWTIYAVTLDENNNRYLLLVSVQSYDTPLYWDYVNWYAAGYNEAVPPTLEVPLYADLAAIPDPFPGLTARVLSNAQNKWEIYQYGDNFAWDRVGLQNGTIAISAGIYDYAVSRVGFDSEVFDSQYFDNSPLIETRKIVEAVFTEIFVGDLAIYVNRLTILLFNYILSEETAPSWLMKTSLIDVTHKIRELIAYANYRRDNQDFVLDYLKEVKPYHVQLRQFDLRYSGQDLFAGDITDFDLPARFDRQIEPQSYQSPILSVNGAFAGNPAALPPSALLWRQFPYNQWYENYLLTLESIAVIQGGSGYTSVPTVSIVGDATIAATAIAAINSVGQVVAVSITSTGSGYSQTPDVVFTGGNGTGAVAYPNLANQLVRSFDISIKFDRYQYQPSFVDWVPNETFDNGTLVRYADLIWEADSPDSTGVNTPTFNSEDWKLVPPSELSGVDRTMGYYVPSPITPGRVLPLLIDGVDYPGVQVKGLAFTSNTGFDLDPFDNLVFDNFAISATGYPTYSDVIIDSIIESSYTDIFLGTRPSDVNIDGGGYVDIYSSYAPEELVPGIEFDTLDFRVYTRPGGNWQGLGHGFAISSDRYSFDNANPTYQFAAALKDPITVQVSNVTQGSDLNLGLDYTVDWVSQIITFLPTSVNQDDILMIRVYGLGGGNQLYRTNYIGDEFGTKVTIPVAFNEIQEFAIFVNGLVNTVSYTFYAVENSTEIEFASSFTASDYISITAIGVTPGAPVPRSWSDPQTQYITVIDGTILTYNLLNSLQGTNAIMPIVTVNGKRVRPYECVEHYADGSIEYLLPTRGGYSQGLTADNEVSVYVDNVLQVQDTDYVVVPWDGSTLRSIEFLGTGPTLGQTIIIAVSTRSQYTISGTSLTFRNTGGFNLNSGDIIAVTTWNDTSEQQLMNYVWVGPVLEGTVTSIEPFDYVPFDIGTVLGGPGTFDYSVDTLVPINNFNLHRPPPGNTERLWVYYNGNRLVAGTGYTLQTENNELYIELPFTINTLDVVSAVIVTDVVAPDAIAFRIFQDMRGLQTTYRITTDSTTILTSAVSENDDIIYLEDANALSAPVVTENILGICTINGERITYRFRDTVNNTISGLMRGTAGTAASSHAVGAEVYDMSNGNALPPQYQNAFRNAVYYSNGTQVQYGLNVILDPSVLEDSTVKDLKDAVVVTVGGTLLPKSNYTVNSIAPVLVTLDTAPPVGVEIIVAVEQTEDWYTIPGVPLQLQPSEAGKFIRGN
jgi:hypothetical protein